jgi:hypothetical protein
MSKPKPGRRYILVRVTRGRIEQAEFTRFPDESIFIVADDGDTIIEASSRPQSATAWADLEARGFVELGDAQASGLVPPDWEPC